MTNLAVLYSLRHCPYAMRARLAIYRSKRAVELRNIVLKNKPAAMLTASPKGTVPVLVLPDAGVIDESLDIMLWALGQQDPFNLLCRQLESQATNYTPQCASQLNLMLELIRYFDHDFKTCLEAYKSAKRYHGNDVDIQRQKCEVFLQDLEQRLQQHRYLMAEQETLADIALLPFIRQCAKVERQWFVQSPYTQLKRWLNEYLSSALFTQVMAPYPLWTGAQAPVYFAMK